MLQSKTKLILIISKKYGVKNETLTIKERVNAHFANRLKSLCR